MHQLLPTFCKKGKKNTDSWLKTETYKYQDTYLLTAVGTAEGVGDDDDAGLDGLPERNNFICGCSYQINENNENNYDNENLKSGCYNQRWMTIGLDSHQHHLLPPN